MSNKVKKEYSFDLVVVLIFIILVFYSVITKNIFDYIYLVVFSSYYFKLKYYRWKKYH